MTRLRCLRSPQQLIVLQHQHLITKHISFEHILRAQGNHSLVRSRLHWNQIHFILSWLLSLLVPRKYQPGPSCCTPETNFTKKNTSIQRMEEPSKQVTLVTQAHEFYLKHELSPWPSSLVPLTLMEFGVIHIASSRVFFLQIPCFGAFTFFLFSFCFLPPSPCLTKDLLSDVEFTTDFSDALATRFSKKLPSFSNTKLSHRRMKVSSPFSLFRSMPAVNLTG